MATRFVSPTARSLSINPLLYASLSYNPNDILPIAMLARAPLFLAVHPKVPAATMSEFIAYARARPGPDQLRLLRCRQHAPSVHGGDERLAQARHDPRALQRHGRVGAGAARRPHRGAVLGLSVAQRRRRRQPGQASRNQWRAALGASAQPPSLAEFIPGFDLAPVIGIFGRSDMPSTVVEKIVAEAVAVVKEPDLIRQLAVVGVEPAGAGPETSQRCFRRRSSVLPRRFRPRASASCRAVAEDNRMPKLELSVATGDYDRVRPLIDGTRCHRRRRARVHDARAGGDLLPGVPARGVRHCRIVALQFHGADGPRRQPLCRRARVPLARLPALGRFTSAPTAASARQPISRAARSVSPNISSPPMSGSAPSSTTISKSSRRRSIGCGAASRSRDGRRRFAITLPHGVSVTEAPAGRSLSELLLAGEIDALIGPRTPSVNDGRQSRGSAGSSPIRAAPQSRITGEQRTSRSCI